MLEIILVIIPPVCLSLHWLLEYLELKQVKEHCNRLSEQNDALWEIVEHLARLKTTQCNEEEAGTDV